MEVKCELSFQQGHASGKTENQESCKITLQTAGPRCECAMSATDPRGTRASSRVHLFVAALVVFFVAACSSPPQPAVTSVAVTAPAEIIAGRTAQATVVVEVAHGASDEVVWSSGNEAVATVSAGGLISALSDGNVIITATSLYDATKSHSVTVSVLNPLRDASVLYYRNGLQGTDAALAALTEAADLYGAVVVQTTDANFVADWVQRRDLVVYLRQNSVAIRMMQRSPCSTGWIMAGRSYSLAGTSPV